MILNIKIIINKKALIFVIKTPKKKNNNNNNYYYCQLWLFFPITEININIE